MTAKSSQKSVADVELSTYGEPVVASLFNDESDMRRMGKKQDFRVSRSLDHQNIFVDVGLTWHIA